MNNIGGFCVFRKRKRKTCIRYRCTYNYFNFDFELHRNCNSAIKRHNDSTRRDVTVSFRIVFLCCWCSAPLLASNFSPQKDRIGALGHALSVTNVA